MLKNIDYDALQLSPEDLTYPKIRDRRRRWADELDNYDQANSFLAGPSYESFCCLGVACEVIEELKTTRTTEEPDECDEVWPQIGYMNPIGEFLHSELNERERALLGLSREQMNLLIAVNDRNLGFGIIQQMLYSMNIHTPDGEFTNWGDPV